MTDTACIEHPKVYIRGERVCERCFSHPPKSGDRYCLKCKPAVLSALARAGYLQPVPAYSYTARKGGAGPMMTGGEESGLWHNLVRQYEEADR